MCDHTLPGKVCLPDPAFLEGEPVISLDANNGDVIIGGPEGGSGQRGRLVITDANATPVSVLNGATGEISQSGDIVLLDNAGNERIRFTGQGAEIIIKNAAGQTTMKLDGETGDVRLGGGGQDGDLLVRNSSGNDTIRMNGNEGDIVVWRDISGTQRRVMRFDASHAALYLGCPDNEGDLIIRNNAGQTSFQVNGNEGDIFVMRDIDGVQRQVMKFDASHAALYLGSQGNEGDIIIRNNAGQTSFQVNGNEGDIFVMRDIDGVQRQVMKFDASHAALYLGSQGNEGDIIIRNNAGQTSFRVDGNEGDVIVMRDIGGVQRQVMKFDASHAALYLGCEGNEGDIFIRNNAGQNSFQVDGNEGDIYVRREIGGVQRQVMKFDASHAALYIGCQGNEGDIFIRNNAGQDSFQVDGNEGDIYVRREIGGTVREVMKFDASHAALYLGCQGNEGDLIVRDGAGNERIRLDGHTGDIRLQGADCAEQFEVAEPETIEPGTVLVIDDDSRLRPCDQPYDRKVAGVVSGANGYSPGLVLDDSLAPNMRLPVALNGKVYCKVDAGFSAIEVGDLLTTSPVVGHAMKATDQSRAFGAVIGKALRGLDTGCGLIPVLVSLQ